MMRKGVNPVEEEFKRYGVSDEEFYREERVAPEVRKKGGVLSKIIHVLVILILVVVLAILAKVGYMFFSNPTTIENVVQKSAMTPVASKEERSVSKAPQPTTAQKSSSVMVPEASQKSVERVASVEVKSSASSSASKHSQVQKQAVLASSSQQEPLQEQLAMALQKSAHSVASQEVSSAKSVEAPPAKALEDMSDEELVKTLLTLKPDQLEKLDIQKIFKKKKSKKPKVKVAKTAYLNNQAIIAPKKVAKNDELSKISQELSSLLGEVEQKSPPKSHKSEQQAQSSSSKSEDYIGGLQSEIKTREKTMRFYVVKEGDNLSKIAKAIYGKASAYIKIYEANQDIITNPRLIFPGQKLRIPEI